MAEYINVEKPFLEKIKQLGWNVIDQGVGTKGQVLKFDSEPAALISLPPSVPSAKIITL